MSRKSSPGFSAFDIADYIKDEKAAACYLQVVQENAAEFATPQEWQDHMRRAQDAVARARARWGTNQHTR